MSRSCRASDRPNICQLRAVDLRLGTTSVKMGMGGRYFATRLAVLPDDAYTTISFACKQNSAHVIACVPTPLLGLVQFQLTAMRLAFYVADRILGKLLQMLILLYWIVPRIALKHMQSENVSESV